MLQPKPKSVLADGTLLVIEYACKTMDTILFITDLHSGSRVRELVGTRDVCSQLGYHVEEIETSRLEASFEDVVRYWSPVGCILEGSANNITETDAFEGIPAVHLDPCDKILDSPTTFTVTNDSEGIADLAVAELAKTECVHFAFIGWTHRVGWSRRRELRFCDLLRRMRRKFSVLNDPWTFGNKADFASRLSPFLAELPKPCGIFAPNDDFAAAILDICAMDGIRVPGDAFIVGADDDPAFCDNLRPSLSSVRPSFAEGGRMAMRLLARLIANPSLPVEKCVYHPLGLTSRLSTRRIAAHSKRVLSALDLIRREACSGLKASDVVKDFGTSERQAEIEFKAVTGKRITQEITDVRFERVMELLSRPSQAIAPIANLCGWDSDIYLKRLFKQRTGMTMREWRASHLAKRS